MQRSRSGSASLTRAVCALGVVVGASIASASHSEAQVMEPPRLTVMIVVDQFRQDVFEHYMPAFQHGFRRLADEGYRFTQASHAHARTSTAPGHATLTTGVLPSRHGVVANNWQQRRGVGWVQTYAVEDVDSPILGFEHIEILGGRSPRTMLREGLPDWFGAMNGRSRRVSISRKDRAAVPMGGQHTEHVYWIIPELARFVTSTYYATDYPQWLRRFNERVMPGILEPEVWESIVPDQYRDLARPDSAIYENDGIHSVFPHVSADELAPDTVRLLHYAWALDQPRADDAVMALAGVAIDELDLGQRNEQDFLALSLSASDRVGHGCGPFGQETLSTLLNVDRLLGEFFELLDEEVGEGRWVVGISGDHGVATMPEYARELGNPDAERILASEVRAGLSQVLNEVARGGGTPDEMAKRLARGVEERGLATRAYTHFDLTRGEMPDSFAVLYRNSYYPGRAWDDLSRWGVDLRYGEGDYVGEETGINHETTYWYDRHVPILFLGAGVQSGVSDAPVYTVDFAPTLAGLAGVIVPDDLDGRRIY